MNMKTTKRRKLRRLAASAALIIILLTAFPLTNVFADYAIDDSEFQNIANSMESKTVYLWHKGKPPMTVNGSAWPVIMYWDNGAQYLDLGTGNSGGKIRSVEVKNYTLEGLIEKHKEEGMRAEKHYDDTNEKHEGGYKARYLHFWTQFGYKPASSLPLNLPALHQYGVAISFSCPNVPYFVAAAGDKMSEAESYYAIEINHGNANNKQVFMTSMLSCYNDMVEDCIGRDIYNWKSFDWILDTYESDRNEFIQNKKYSKKYVYSDGSGTYTSALKDRAWDVRTEKDGWYTFRQEGVTLDRKEDAESDSWWMKTGHGILNDALKSWKCHMELYHTSDKGFGAHGWTGKGTGKADFSVSKNYINEYNGMDNTSWAFQLAYATTMPMSFVKGDFTVQNGQTTNLDGPVGINKNRTITVEDGGVLVISGWVTNNGTIKVKKGGTLIIMDKTDADGYDVKGILATYNSDKNETAGEIKCDGTIVVMPGCKLHCGGIGGLQLGSSAQVVNYGAILTVNLTVKNSYTIENRGDDSLIGIGYDIIDGGYTLTAADISVKNGALSYPGLGRIQGASNSVIAMNGIYGKGKDRVYTYKTGYSTYNYYTGNTPKADYYYTIQTVINDTKKIDAEEDNSWTNGFWWK